MKRIIAFLCSLCAIQGNATQIPFEDLTNLVAEADHVLIGTVTRVDMIDGRGHQVTDEKAGTPKTGNQLRLHVQIGKDGILATTTNQAPDRLTIPLGQEWHDTLGNRRKESEGKTFIFLLKGADFSPVYFGDFMREPSERPAIEDLLKKKNTQNPQGGANRTQPLPSETNRTSAAAISRRSP